MYQGRERMEKREWAVLILGCLLVVVATGCTVKACKCGLYAIRKRPARAQWADTCQVWPNE